LEEDGRSLCVQFSEIIAVGTKLPEISNAEQTAPNGMTVKITNVNLIEGATSNTLKVSYTETNNTQARVDQNSFVLYLSDGSNRDQYGGFNSLMPGQSTNRSYSFQLLKSETSKTLEYGDVFFNTSPQPGNPILDGSYLSN
jgi:hypothetical protein